MKLFPIVMGHIVYYGIIFCDRMFCCCGEKGMALCCSHRMDGFFSVLLAIPPNSTHGL